MVERGVLQLEGSASSSSTNPVSFQSIVQSVRTSAQSTGGEIPVGSSLAGWIKEVTARLETQRFQLDDLFTRPVPSVGQGLESEIQRLQRDVQAIKAAVMRDAKPSNAVRGSPRSLQQVTATAATAGIASPSGFVGLPVLAEPAPEPEIAEGAVLDRLRRPDDTTVQESERESIDSDDLGVSRDSGVAQQDDSINSVSSTLLELRLDKSAALPLIWREAFDRGDDLADAQSGRDSVPTEDLYLRRVHQYRDELQRVDPLTEFMVVHFQKSAGASQHLIKLVEFSKYSDDSSAGGFANPGMPPAWQFAVLAGQSGGDLFYLVFPSSILDKSKYASVYSVIIEDLPEGSFPTRLMDGPAVLAYDKTNDLFSIVKKIRLKDRDDQPVSKG